MPAIPRTPLALGLSLLLVASPLLASPPPGKGKHGGGHDEVQIDLRDAHLWDLTAVAALERAQERLAAHGAEVSVVGLNAASQAIVQRLAIYDKPGADLSAH